MFGRALHTPVLSRKQALTNIEAVLGTLLRSRFFIFSERVPSAADIADGNIQRIFLLLEELFRACVIKAFIDFRISVPSMVVKGLTTVSQLHSHAKLHNTHHSLWDNIFHHEKSADASENNNDVRLGLMEGSAPDRYSSGDGGWSNSGVGSSTSHRFVDSSSLVPSTKSNEAPTSAAISVMKNDGIKRASISMPTAPGGIKVKETRATKLLREANIEKEKRKVGWYSSKPDVSNLAAEKAYVEEEKDKETEVDKTISPSKNDPWRASAFGSSVSRFEKDRKPKVKQEKGITHAAEVKKDLVQKTGGS